MFKRPIFNDLIRRFNEKRRFIQVLSGPRQTGKTTLARQITDTLNVPIQYASADDPALKGQAWIEQQWETARAKLKSHPGKRALLILDEIQKIPRWSESVKRLWDEDTLSRKSLYVLLLGSSPLLMQKGLTESLAGRFEVIHVAHWPFNEMRDAFGWTVDTYIYFGGYPGSAELISDQERWKRYILDSIVEPTISRDILLMTRIDKPALLRRLFELGCMYSGQVLSYQKMLGQLQDAGNTTTVAHYLKLLESAGMIAGLQKYAGQRVRQRGSSPKFQVMNTALTSALLHLSFDEAHTNPDVWGRLVESSVGASLLNGIAGKDMELYYWAGFNREVDFVLRKGKKVAAIEVKTGKKKTSLPGMELLTKEFKITKKLLVGEYGIPIEEFLLKPAEFWID
jgi:hypothetical protein